jgi:alpha-tubulin suppressor-like RCC1 family protein
VVQIALGAFHSCVLLESGTVRCWGSGPLGYGSSDVIGDDSGETPGSGGDVDVGGPVRHLASSRDHVCVALASGQVRCWGPGGDKLGYGDGDDGFVGDNETPAQRGVVDVGGDAIQVAAGTEHSCALLSDGAVRCWGAAGLLGTKAVFSIGEGEAPATGPTIELGGAATQIVAGTNHTCALLEDKTVRCWGSVGEGQLGYGNLEHIGDDETPEEVGAVPVGGPVVQVAAGEGHTCALLEDKTVRCWGRGDDGQLGYGDDADVGYAQTPGSLPSPVDVGGDVEFIAVGGAHTCAVLTSGALRCWGANAVGQLGHPAGAPIGDDEAPATAGDVPWLD